MSVAAIISLLAGLVSIPGCFCCFGYATAPVAVISGAFALVQYKNGQANIASRNMAIAGIAIPVLFFVAYFIFMLVVYGVAGLTAALENGGDFSTFNDYHNTY